MGLLNRCSSTGFLLCSVLATAVTAASARASGKASRLYVPVGYDDNDEVVVVIEGYLENTCEQIRGAKVTQNGVVFEIDPRVETQGTDCDKLKVPYKLDVLLNPDEPLPARDDYEVQVMGIRGKPIVEPLKIEVSPTTSTNALPYAPVDNVDVGLLSGGKMRAVVSGRFQNTCIVMDRIDLSTSNGKTYELRPITKRLPKDPKGNPCTVDEKPFTASKDFKEPAPGRYLLHVRTQSGHSVNRIFTNIW